MGVPIGSFCKYKVVNACKDFIDGRSERSWYNAPILQVRKVIPCAIHPFIHSFTYPSIHSLIHSLACTPEHCIPPPGSPAVSAPLKHMWRGEVGSRFSPAPGLLFSLRQGGSCSQTCGSYYKHPRLILISPVRSVKQQMPRNFGCVPWLKETQRNGRELTPFSASHTQSSFQSRRQWVVYPEGCRKELPPEGLGSWPRWVYFLVESPLLASLSKSAKENDTHTHTLPSWGTREPM